MIIVKGCFFLQIEAIHKRNGYITFNPVLCLDIRPRLFCIIKKFGLEFGWAVLCLAEYETAIKCNNQIIDWYTGSR